ncbi:hypothetical protein [Aeromicrobium sp. NPDC092404]|uniref:hypothetical protein n=1 Tax=Aeromicrobium sp. NPDC092404 TaxID=3154976 RepID=UPI00342131CC
MRSPARAATAVAAVLLATLAACESEGGGEPKPSASTPTTVESTPLSSEPADGNAVSNDDFSFSVPDGWEESETRAVSLAVDVEDSDGFPDNINVVSDDTFLDLEGADLEDAAEDILGDASATRITTHEAVEIDGEEAVHTSAYFELGTPKYRAEQYVVSHDDKGFVITLSFSPDVPAAERRDISTSILTTWTWES